MTRAPFPLAVLLLAAAGARAAEPAAGGARAWKDAAELTLLNTTGNSRTVLYGANNLFTDSWGRAGLELKAGALGSKSQGRTSAEQYNAGEKGTWKFGERLYAFEVLGWEKNRFAGIRSRYDFSAGPGVTLFDAPKDKLVAELGVGYTSEERIGSPARDFVTGRLYSRYTHAFNAAVNFSQDLEYLRDFEDGRDYRVNTETAFISALSNHLSLKASYKWKRVNRPPVGFVKDDTIAALALIVNL